MVGTRPSGMVTFLFTDIEGSTRLWSEHPDTMAATLARHDGVLRSAIESHRGFVFATGGDGFAAAFDTPDDAIGAAQVTQRGLVGLGGPAEPELRVRIGISTGQAFERDGDYFGPEVNRAARIMDAAHGGQVLLSASAAALASAECVDLGEHRLRDLSSVEHIFQVPVPGVAAAFPPLRTLDQFTSNLPQALSSFVGRTELLAELEHLLDQNRLVTLTGVGGVGKTRLALQLAAAVLPSFADGAWFVPLATTATEEEVLDAIGVAVGLPESRSVSMEALIDSIRDKTKLIALDNCEHVIEAVASITAEVLENCPAVQVVATSREGLGVPGEIQRTVPSLTGADAVDLFLQRADAVDAQLLLDDASATSVADLCDRLDGVPLALELAAARTRTMTPAEILSRLDRRFRLLASRDRGLVKRHQTMEATIDWSYDLLDPREKDALNRCATFSGGFDLEAAQRVMATDPIDEFELLDLLSSLVDKSLVVVSKNVSGTRYSMLETIREYGFRKLIDSGVADGVRDAHAEFFADRNRETCAGLCTEDESQFQTRFDLDLDNLRSAIGWATAAGNGLLAAALIAPMARPIFSIRADAVGAARDVMEMPGIPPDAFASIANVAVYDAYLDYDADAGAEIAARAIAADGASPGVWRVGALPHMLNGDFRTSIRMATHGVELARAVDDRFELAHCLTGLALYSTMALDPQRVAVAREAVEAATSVGNPTLVCHANLALAFATVDDDPAVALEASRAGIEAGQLTGALGLGDCYIQAAAALYALGRHEEMAPLLIDGLPHLMQLRARAELALAMLYCALAIGSVGEHHTAREIVAIASASSPVLLTAGNNQPFLAELESMVGPIDPEQAGDRSINDAVEIALAALRSLAD